MGTANTGTLDTDGDGAADFRTCQVGGNLTGNFTIPNVDGVLYSISGRYSIGTDSGPDDNGAGENAVLTIEPGVTLFGSSGADFLVVQRGSQIFAEGTPTAPIIFTSRGNIVGQANADSIGQWGGVVLLGTGPINSCDAPGAVGGTVDCQTQVEGTNAFFGGGDPNDSTGRLSYVQVRFPGFEISDGNELNGITLAGIGSGTSFNFVQVHNSSDDGLEWFGGTVDGDHLVVSGADDDSLDTDAGYIGGNQFIIVTQRAAGGDHFIEADNDGDDPDNEPRSNVKVANFTFVGQNANDVGILLRVGTDYGLINGTVTGQPACIDIDDQSTVDAAPTFESVYLTCPTAFLDDGNIDVATIQSLFNMGSNNTADGTSTLTDLVVNGPNEAAVTAFADLPSVDSSFEQVDYIGAVRDAADTWYQSWTCGLPGSPRTCEEFPAPTPTS